MADSVEMGAEGIVALDNEMQLAKDACGEYRSKISELVNSMTEIVNNLVNDGFAGEAGNGFKEFYTKNIESFFAAGNTFDKYIGSFDTAGTGLFDQIENSLVKGEGLDPSLGNNNKNLGGNNAQQATTTTA